ncbi:type II toxin-antitoxin system RelE/ParE family toxin [Asticcacaulis taihuensis]|jgi:hypothetical protein|uniref:type II toxin-antitoxin system RelE/ParE family toxin n=1 Tax=Asticcacaulis taihuensis TaxID=260084 RepID=UPI0026F1B7DB|nr:type II toxin-antitoxin system RelE/ParE family toxin [Asticcacaulis taihuensis]
MEFIETPTFTRQVTELLSDDVYRAFQIYLAERPDQGDLIKGGGGIRKVRCAQEGRGKSGGIRIIYYWVRDDHLIYMLVAYPKTRKDTLSDREVAILAQLVKAL